MPTFYTKTISKILEPVAQQVSLLVILHEEAESGVIIPDLSAPIGVVKKAVNDLTQIGVQTYKSSRDEILKRDMPVALKRVEEASNDLEAATMMLGQDRKSVIARKKLIDGSRGILQGTSSVLVVYDLSEVRKIIAICNNVKCQLNQVENIRSMEQLAAFIKDVTPQLTAMTKLTISRADELIVKAHSDILVHSIDQIKNSIPLMVSSLKTYIINTDNPGVSSQLTDDECRKNRNYTILKLLEHIQEIIRILQMTGDNETAWENEEYAVLSRAKMKIDGRSGLIHGWVDTTNEQLIDSSLYEVAVKDLMSNLEEIAMNCSDHSLKIQLNNELKELLADYASIKELVQTNETGSPEFIKHKANFKTHYDSAMITINEAVSKSLSQSCNQLTARTIEGRIAQAEMWLLGSLDGPQCQLGVQACASLSDDVREMRRHLLLVNDNSSMGAGDMMLKLGNNIENKSNRLHTLAIEGNARTPEAQKLTQELLNDLGQLKINMSGVIIDQVTHNFVDLKGPMRRLTEAAMVTVITPERTDAFQDAANEFLKQGDLICATASVIPPTVADMQNVASLKAEIEEIKLLTPQVVSAGKIVLLNGGENCVQPIKDHFNNLRTEWDGNVEKLTTEIDKLTDTPSFVAAQESAIDMESDKMEVSIRNGSSSGIVEGTSNIARRANRIAQKADIELSHNEDPRFVDNLERSVTCLRKTITPMAMSAKSLMVNVKDQSAIEGWRSHNNELREAVKTVRLNVTPSYTPSTISGSLQSVTLSTTDTRSDNEADDHFNYPAAQSNQPILAAAHVLHSEARQWSSKDNEIVAAAKRMANLMAQLSQLVRGDNGSKKELIDVAKEIAEASEEVTRCAKRLGEACTDIRIKNNLLQICDRIPTIGTQLRILSTVKATMIGTQEDTEDISEELTYVTQEESELNCGSDEDQEATEMLVGNAQNLMQNVVETVRAAEAASIKVRVDSGCKIRWTKRAPR